jgi:pimeloyl-ACP methyl ester carboxylesterase
LARELAAAGWRVLRFDPRGIGDSNGPHDCDSVDEVYCRIDEGALVPDTLAAIDFLSNECGMETCVLTGLCGGATTSLRVAAVDDRVVGVSPLELPLKYNPAPGSPEHHPKADRNLWVDQISRRRGTRFLLYAYALARTAKSHARRVKVRFSKLIDLVSGSVSRDFDWFREQIGEDVNDAMLEAFQTVLAKRIPVFCIYSDSRDAHLFQLVLPGLTATDHGDAPPLHYIVIPGKDHVFTMPGQPEALTRSLMSWLDSGPWAGGRFHGGAASTSNAVSPALGPGPPGSSIMSHAGGDGGQS